MKEQRIIVISPFFNAKPYLRRCVDSVASQAYKNYQHILIDDASTDGWQEDILYHGGPNIKFIRNTNNMGAVYNQINTVRLHTETNDIIMLLDGDDALVNDPEIFNFYNRLYRYGAAEFTYGSCWSMADNIPLIAQPYPEYVKKSKLYRDYRFIWNMPYPHLRTFRRHLLDRVPDDAFRDEEKRWYREGGDNAVFYNIIEQADPERVYCVPDVFYMYNDLNPLNDYKVHTETQNAVAEKILSRNPEVFHTPGEEDRWIANAKKHAPAMAEAEAGFMKSLKMTPLLVSEQEYLDAIMPKPYDPGAVIIGGANTFHHPLSNNYIYSPPVEKPFVQDSEPNAIWDYHVDSRQRMFDTLPKFVTTAPKKILIAIPTSEYVKTDCFKAIYDLEVPPGYETDFQCFYGNNISQVRNLIADWVIKGYDYLFAVDSDIAFPPDTLKKLLAHNVDVVSGLYMQRKPDEVNLELYDLWYQRCHHSIIHTHGLVEVGGCGFGCVLIKKEVLVGMGYPHFHWVGDLDHKGMTEDVYFCSKARQKGYKIYADTTVRCDHLGPYRYEIPIVAPERPFVSFEDGYRDLSKVSSMPIDHYEYLKAMDFKQMIHPKVIYDIGACVLHWTNMAKKVWPDAKYFLFEASPFCEFLYKEQGYPYHLGVLDEYHGKEIDFYCNGNNPGGNGIYKNNPKYIPGVDALFADGFKQKMITSTLDNVVLEKGWPQPDLMKLDVQGSELAVLRGATKALSYCKDIIIEMPAVELQLGAPAKKEIVDYLNIWGFEMVENFTNGDFDGDYHFRKTRISGTGETI